MLCYLNQLDVNFLLSQSLITISTLPFHLVNDLWRWRAFREDSYNLCHFRDIEFLLNSFSESHSSVQLRSFAQVMGNAPVPLVHRL